MRRDSSAGCIAAAPAVPGLNLAGDRLAEAAVPAAVAVVVIAALPAVIAAFAGSSFLHITHCNHPKVTEISRNVLLLYATQTLPGRHSILKQRVHHARHPHKQEDSRVSLDEGVLEDHDDQI